MQFARVFLLALLILVPILHPDATNCTNCNDCTNALMYSFYDTVNLGTKIAANGTGSVCITIDSVQNKIFDCKGFNIDNVDGDIAFNITNSRNLTIKNCPLWYFDTGALIVNSTNITLTNSNITGTTNPGIVGVNSSNSTINLSNNNICHHEYDLYSDNWLASVGDENACESVFGGWHEDIFTDGCTYTCIQETVPPEIQLIYPRNASTVKYFPVKFQVNATDNSGNPMSCGLLVDYQLRDTKMLENGVATYFNIKFYPSTYGAHIWKVICKDRSRNKGYSSEYTFYVNNTSDNQCECDDKVSCIDSLNICEYLILSSDINITGSLFDYNPNMANKTIDCLNHTITGSGTGYAFYLDHGNSYNKIQNCRINNFSAAAYSYLAPNVLSESQIQRSNQNNSFINLTIWNCTNGIYIKNYVEGYMGGWWNGSIWANSSYYQFSNITIFNVTNSGIYMQNYMNCQYNWQRGCPGYAQSDYFTFSNVNVQNSSKGIYLELLNYRNYYFSGVTSSGHSFTNISIYNVTDGISIYAGGEYYSKSSGNTFTNITLLGARGNAFSVYATNSTSVDSMIFSQMTVADSRTAFNITALSGNATTSVNYYSFSNSVINNVTNAFFFNQSAIVSYAPYKRAYVYSNQHRFNNINVSNVTNAFYFYTAVNDTWDFCSYYQSPRWFYYSDFYYGAYSNAHTFSNINVADATRGFYFFTNNTQRPTCQWGAAQSNNHSFTNINISNVQQPLTFYAPVYPKGNSSYYVQDFAQTSGHIINNLVISNSANGINATSSNFTMNGSSVSGAAIGLLANNSVVNLTYNRMCGNTEYDLYSANWSTSYGLNNTCDLFDSWTVEVGVLGCTNLCEEFNISEPVITLLTPAAGATVTKYPMWLNFTALDDDSATMLCGLILDNKTIYLVNMSNGTIEGLQYFLDPGTHYWKVMCYDESFHRAVSEERYFIAVAGICECWNSTDCSSAASTNSCANITLMANITQNGTFLDYVPKFSSKIFDCQNNTIRGSGTGYAFHLNENNSNVTIKDCNIINFTYGVLSNITNNMSYTSTSKQNGNNTFRNLNISYTNAGIMLSTTGSGTYYCCWGYYARDAISNNDTFDKIYVTNSTYGFYIYAYGYYSSVQSSYHKFSNLNFTGANLTYGIYVTAYGPSAWWWGSYVYTNGYTFSNLEFANTSMISGVFMTIIGSNGYGSTYSNSHTFSNINIHDSNITNGLEFRVSNAYGYTTSHTMSGLTISNVSRGVYFYNAGSSGSMGSTRITDSTFTDMPNGVVYETYGYNTGNTVSSSIFSNVTTPIYYYLYGYGGSLSSNNVSGVSISGATIGIYYYTFSGTSTFNMVSNTTINNTITGVQYYTQSGTSDSNVIDGISVVESIYGVNTSGSNFTMRSSSIMNNTYGVYSSNSTITLNNNYLCYNLVYDIFTPESTWYSSRGSNNTCRFTRLWQDMGSPSGCTNKCVALSNSTLNVEIIEPANNTDFWLNYPYQITVTFNASSDTFPTVSRCVLFVNYQYIGGVSNLTNGDNVSFNISTYMQNGINQVTVNCVDEYFNFEEATIYMNLSKCNCSNREECNAAVQSTMCYDILLTSDVNISDFFNYTGDFANDSALMGYWYAGNMSGLTLFDSSKYMNNATGNAGIERILDSSGYAINFNAPQRGYIIIPNAPQYHITGDFTIEVGVKPTSGNAMAFLSRGRTRAISFGQCNGTPNSFVIYKDSYGHPAVFLDSSTQTLVLTGSSNIENKWSHIAIVRNGTTLSLYVNGVRESYGTIPSLWYLSNWIMEMGVFREACTDSAYSYLNGMMDMVRIWNRSLSAAEILNNSAAYVEKNTSGYVPRDVFLAYTPAFKGKIFDCGGHTIRGNNTFRAFEFGNKNSDNALRNCIVENFIYGIYSANANDNMDNFEFTNISLFNVTNSIMIYANAYDHESHHNSTANNYNFTNITIYGVSRDSGYGIFVTSYSGNSWWPKTYVYTDNYSFYNINISNIAYAFSAYTSSTRSDYSYMENNYYKISNMTIANTYRAFHLASLGGRDSPSRSNNHTVSNISIYNVSEWAMLMYTKYSSFSYNNFSDVLIRNATYDVYLGASEGASLYYNSFRNFTIEGLYSHYGIYIFSNGTSFNSNLYYNNFADFTISNTTFAIYLYSNLGHISYNNFTNFNITNATSYGLYSYLWLSDFNYNRLVNFNVQTPGTAFYFYGYSNSIWWWPNASNSMSYLNFTNVTIRDATNGIYFNPEAGCCNAYSNASYNTFNDIYIYNTLTGIYFNSSERYTNNFSYSVDNVLTNVNIQNSKNGLMLYGNNTQLTVRNSTITYATALGINSTNATINLYDSFICYNKYADLFALDEKWAASYGVYNTCLVTTNWSDASSTGQRCGGCTYICPPYGNGSLEVSLLLPTNNSTVILTYPYYVEFDYIPVSYTFSTLEWCALYVDCLFVNDSYDLSSSTLYTFLQNNIKYGSHTAYTLCHDQNYNINNSETISFTIGECHCSTKSQCNAALASDSCQYVVLTNNLTVNGNFIDYQSKWYNKTFDCNGSVITGDSTGSAFVLQGGNYYNTIKNCNIRNFTYGINNTLSGYANANDNGYNKFTGLNFTNMNTAIYYYVSPIYDPATSNYNYFSDIQIANSTNGMYFYTYGAGNWGYAGTDYQNITNVNISNVTNAIWFYTLKGSWNTAAYSRNHYIYNVSIENVGRGIAFDTSYNMSPTTSWCSSCYWDDWDYAYYYPVSSNNVTISYAQIVNSTAAIYFNTSSYSNRSFSASSNYHILSDVNITNSTNGISFINYAKLYHATSGGHRITNTTVSNVTSYAMNLANLTSLYLEESDLFYNNFGIYLDHSWITTNYTFTMNNTYGLYSNYSVMTAEELTACFNVQYDIYTSSGWNVSSIGYENQCTNNVAATGSINAWNDWNEFGCTYECPFHSSTPPNATLYLPLNNEKIYGMPINFTFKGEDIDDLFGIPGTGVYDRLRAYIDIVGVGRIYFNKTYMNGTIQTYMYNNTMLKRGNYTVRFYVRDRLKMQGIAEVNITIEPKACLCYSCQNCTQIAAEADCELVILSHDITSNGSCFTNLTKQLDCNGTTIRGNGQGYGIITNNAALIYNCTIVDFQYGIYGNNSNTSVYYSKFYDNDYAMYATGSEYSYMYNNTMQRNTFGLISNISLFRLEHNFVCYNEQDIYSENWLNSTGINNSCSGVNWNDQDRTGCTNLCDFVAPTVTLEAPEDGAVVQEQPILLNFTTYDDKASVMNCSVSITDEVLENVIYNLSARNNTLESVNVSGLSQGVHYWEVTCWDFAKNNGMSERWSFVLDSYPPQIILNTPVNGSYMFMTPEIYLQSMMGMWFVTFNFTAIDNLSSFMNCTVNVSDDIKGSLSEFIIAENGTPMEVNISTLDFGYHFWNVTCTDVGNNTIESETWTLLLKYPDGRECVRDIQCASQDCCNYDGMCGMCDCINSNGVCNIKCPYDQDCTGLCIYDLDCNICQTCVYGVCMIDTRKDGQCTNPICTNDPDCINATCAEGLTSILGVCTDCSYNGLCEPLCITGGISDIDCCEQNWDCPQDEICYNGQCQQNCEEDEVCNWGCPADPDCCLHDSMCGAGKKCQNNTCLLNCVEDGVCNSRCPSDPDCCTTTLDCRAGKCCLVGTCAPCVDDNAPAAPCDVDTQCLENQCCVYGECGPCICDLDGVCNSRCSFDPDCLIINITNKTGCAYNNPPCGECAVCSDNKCNPSYTIYTISVPLEVSISQNVRAKVLDELNNPISGVAVEISYPRGGKTIVSSSDDGSFNFTADQEGLYSYAFITPCITTKKVVTTYAFGAITSPTTKTISVPIYITEPTQVIVEVFSEGNPVSASVDTSGPATTLSGVASKNGTYSTVITTPGKYVFTISALNVRSLSARIDLEAATTVRTLAEEPQIAVLVLLIVLAISVAYFSRKKVLATLSGKKVATVRLKPHNPAAGDDITLTFSDETGAPVKNTTVVIISSEGETFESTTDEKGKMIFIPPRAGTYTIISSRMAIVNDRIEIK